MWVNLEEGYVMYLWGRLGTPKGLVVVAASFVQINGLSFGVLCMHLVMMKAMTRQMHRLLLRGWGCPKGQLNLEWNFGVFNFPKELRKNLEEFLP